MQDKGCSDFYALDLIEKAIYKNHCKDKDFFFHIRII